MDAETNEGYTENWQNIAPKWFSLGTEIDKSASAKERGNHAEGFGCWINCNFVRTALFLFAHVYILIQENPLFVEGIFVCEVFGGVY
jgi:hypothetical protein